MKDTKEHILLNALQLFLHKSYKEVTMQEIVTQAGLSKGAFYHYFCSKEQVFEEVVRYFYSNKLLIKYQNLPDHSLKSFYKAYLDHMQHLSNFVRDMNVQGINIFVFLDDANKRLPTFSEIQEAQKKKEKQFWQKAIVNARKSGEIETHLSDESVADLFINLCDGIALNTASKYYDYITFMTALTKNLEHLYSLLAPAKASMG